MRKMSFKACFCVSIFLLMTLMFFRATFSLAASEPLSSASLITDAYKSGEMDLKTYIIQKLRSYVAPDTVDTAFTSAVPNKPTREITILLILARQNWDLFSEEDKAFIENFSARPSPFEETHESTNFKLWYDKTGADAVAAADADGDGVPDYVENMATEFENVYKVEITDMGYNAPPKDSGDAAHGGNDKFDVYIYKLDAGVYGWCASEDTVGAAGDTSNEKTSYMAMRNDYTGFSGTATQNIQVTAAHEFHHATQFGYNFNADTWYMEATSTWMEDQVYDAVDDNLQYLNGTDADDFFYHPEISLDTATDHWYGTWIWNEFLETKWDQATIKANWDNLDEAGKNNAADANVTTLVAKGSSLKDAFTAFVAKNYSQKGFYTNHLNYDEVKIENKTTPHELDYSTATSHQVAEVTVNVDNLASRYYKFVPGASLKKPAMLSITVNGADGKDVNAIAIVKKKDDSFVEYLFTLDDTTKEGEVGISGFSSEEVTEVVLALVNYSKADDNLEIKYKAELMKGFAFVIDDTGSMGEEIAAAKAAANKVLDDNKAKSVKRFYTLISFKDGSGTIRGQSSDEDIMKTYVNALSYGGGNECPESSLLSIRQAADLSEGSDIMMMTDASSNSYGVDDTYAGWGEVFETIFKLLETNSRLHCIVYSDCDTYKVKGAGATGSSEDESLQCPGCYYSDGGSFTSAESPDGIGGYDMASTESGGLFFHISTAETETVTEMILRASTSDSTIAYFDGDGLDTYTAPVDSSVTQLQIVMNSDAASSLTLEVTNPSSAIVNDTTDGVSVLSAGGNSFYLIDAPALATGNWTAVVSGTGTYRFSAEGATSNPMTYTGDTSLGVGGTLNMECNVIEAVSGISFALVKLDGSDSMDVTLTSTDDLNYSGTQVISTVDSYRFRVTGDGNYQRMYPANITIGNLDVIAPPAAEATAGASLTHTFQIQNLGTEEDTYVVSASSSLGWADVSGISSSITIAAGGTEEVDVPVSVPADATSVQSDTLSLQAYSEANPMINDTDETETRIAPLYDFDGDGDVDVVDIMIVASHWNTSEGDDDYNVIYDLDGDGDIDTTDIMKVVAQWGRTE